MRCRAPDAGVFRRIGGLETQATSLQNVCIVFRRIGGLENMMPLSTIWAGVFRRIGGLEIRVV